LNKSSYGTSPWGSYRKGVDKLKECHLFLRDSCHSWCELYTVISFDGSRLTAVQYHYKYQIMDPYKRTMNIHDLAQEAYNCKDVEEKSSYRFTFNHWRMHSRYWNPEKDTIAGRIKKRCKPVNDSYRRRQKTYQEMKIGCDEIHRNFTRGKRVPHRLNRYNLDTHMSVQGSWKGLKIKHQWEERLR